MSGISEALRRAPCPVSRKPCRHQATAWPRAGNTLCLVKLAREIERRLEGLVEGLAGKVFRGPFHPVELTSRLVREADLTVRSTEIGPSADNAFEVRISPGETADELPPGLLNEMAAGVEDSAIERGWRLEGPVRITLIEDPAVAPGNVVVTSSVLPGPLPPWATLEGRHGSYELTHNRELVGRSDHTDVLIAAPHVSRQHAVIWRDSAGVHVEDFRSANGTRVDGERVQGSANVSAGSVITFGNAAFTLRLV